MYGLPTFTCIYHINKQLNVGKYTSPTDGLGDRTNANFWVFPELKQLDFFPRENKHPVNKWACSGPDCLDV